MKIRCFLILICFTWLLDAPLASYAETGKQKKEEGVYNLPPGNKENIYNQPPKDKTPSKLYLTRYELIISSMVLTFGVIVLLLQFLLMKSADIKSEGIISAFTVTLIIVGALFLIAAGYKTEDITPVIGLFGTVAGYVLGKETNKKKEKNEEK